MHPQWLQQEAYAVEGTIVGYTQDDYDKALEEKYGRICTEKVEALRRQSPPFTNPEDQPIRFTECSTKEFWFHKGIEVESASKWQGLKCDDEVAANINTTGIKIRILRQSHFVLMRRQRPGITD